MNELSIPDFATLGFGQEIVTTDGKPAVGSTQLSIDFAAPLSAELFNYIPATKRAADILDKIVGFIL